MVITEVKKLKEDRYKICFDDGSFIKTTPTAMAELYLFKGKELNHQEYENACSASSLSVTKSKAARAISYRAMSRAELIKKLCEKDEPRENAQQAADWLEEIGLIDDLEYGKMLVRHYAAKGYGIDRIKSELFRRGISRDIWEDVLEEMPEQDDKIDMLLYKKLKGEKPDYRELQKAKEHLRRRGFSWSDIRSAVSRYMEQLQEEESDDDCE